MEGQARTKIWTCKIGEVGREDVPEGADWPMRESVERTYKRITGKDSVFIFSGWGGELTESERAVVEDREPVHVGALDMPHPTEEQLQSPRFEAVWAVIKSWDVNVPELYDGYCGANASHVALILNALDGSPS